MDGMVKTNKVNLAGLEMLSTLPELIEAGKVIDSKYNNLEVSSDFVAYINYLNIRTEFLSEAQRKGFLIILMGMEGFYAKYAVINRKTVHSHDIQTIYSLKSPDAHQIFAEIDKLGRIIEESGLIGVVLC